MEYPTSYDDLIECPSPGRSSAEVVGVSLPRREDTAVTEDWHVGEGWDERGSWAEGRAATVGHALVNERVVRSCLGSQKQWFNVNVSGCSENKVLPRG